MIARYSLVTSTVLVVLSLGFAQAPNSDSATFDADGTAHITRVVPMPTTVSPEAQQWLMEIEHEAPQPKDLAELRKGTDEWRKRDSDEARRRFPVKIAETTMAGVRSDVIMPIAVPESNQDRVLINLHGGGFISDSGSLIEGIPIAYLAKVKIVSVYYRLAPENPFPAAVDDVVAVYKTLLKTYKPQKIGIFGTSAGAILTGEVASRLKQLGLPLPGALGMFSTLADFSRPSDSQQLFALNGFAGSIEPEPTDKPQAASYIGEAAPKDSVLSPLFADLHGWPPCLLVTSTRDLLLSNTSIFHLALLRAGVDSQLLVFDALPHAFWYHFQLPETQEALKMMAKFFEENLGR
jgi:monoterpene epsilon-lactone hydrolase